jgi:hypothetical protein
MLINAGQDMGTAGNSVSPTKQSKTRGHTKKLLTRIGAAHSSGKKALEKRHVALFLNSYEAHHTAVVRAVKQFPKSKRPDAATIKAIAQKLDPWKGTQEPVAVSYKKKKSNPDERRITMNFGIENSALQYLILMVLEKTADLHPRQYATKGGVHSVIKQVAKAMSDGYLHAVELDIEDCYSSFVGEKVPDLLPLPKKVTLRTALCCHLNLTIGNLDDLFGTASILTQDLLAEARHGIPQGSAASNLIAEILLSNTFENQSPTAGRVFSYADNIMIMGHNEGDVKSTQLALESALKAHPAGPLVPKAKHFKSGDSIDFLGHRLTCKCGKVLIEPSPANRNEFKKKLIGGLSAVLQKTTPVAVRRARIKRLRTFVLTWVAAFKTCDGIQLVKKHWLSKLAAAEKALMIHNEAQLPVL